MVLGAQHSGIVDAEGGFFKLTRLTENPKNFVGSTANGITTKDYGSYGGILIEAVDEETIQKINASIKCTEISCLSSGRFYFCVGKNCTSKSGVWVFQFFDRSFSI